MHRFKQAAIKFLGKVQKPHPPILLAAVGCYRAIYVGDMADITVQSARASHIHLEKNCGSTAHADNLECSDLHYAVFCNAPDKASMAIFTTYRD